MRRLIIEDPVSSAALWAWRVASFALAVTLLSIGIIRFGLVDVKLGLLALLAGLALAGAAILLTLVSFARIWREGHRGLGLAVRSLVLGALILAWPAFIAVRAANIPTLSDVATDLADPPAFSRSRAALAAREGRIPPDPPAAMRAKQAGAYAGLGSVTLDTDPQAAFALVLKAAGQRRWQVVDSVRPGGRSSIGHLDAVDRSPILRIPEDVTVRVRPYGAGTQIDVRSASRAGYHDLGSNAQRIQRFLEELAVLAQDL